MQSTHPRRSALGLIALFFVGLAFAAATNTAGASHHNSQRLVVRGDSTVADAPCADGVCIELTDGTFRGTPTGTGAYTGSLKLRVADAFENGEGGVCAPIDGQIVLGAGSPNRLVLAVFGDSCQDGAGDPAAGSFTGLAQFRIKYGTGTYAKARGGGLLTSSEDAADRDRMTLIGRISR
jgi:type 1 fimbria pilin